MNDWDSMVDQLGPIPDLPGAMCVGSSQLYDSTIVGAPGSKDDENLEYARTAALRLCNRCPALQACAGWLDTIPARHQPAGVIAGRINTPGGKPMHYNPPPRDDARARRVVAALAADEESAAVDLIAEAKLEDRGAWLALALGHHVLEIAREFYDIDCFEVLQRKALSALDKVVDDDARNADDGDVP